MNMLSKLQYLFLPNERNNQKAKALHSSSLFILLFLIVGFQSILSFVIRAKPGVLGFASNVKIEDLLSFTNKQRQKNGLKPLKLNNSLIDAATQKAALMFNFNCWAHNCNGQTPWYFFKNAGYDYLFAGENLARDFGDSQSVVKAWMDSPTHRENILNQKYEEIGFAVVDGILDGEETTLVVQMFGAQAKQPAIASGKSETFSYNPQVKMAEKTAEILLSTSETESKPIISSFILTKSFSLFLVVILIIILSLDTALIYYRQTVRISSKSFIHMSFFIIIFISILLFYQGQIL